MIDSVFSIGVRYERVRNVIERYCRQSGLAKQSPKGTVLPRNEQESISAFLTRVAPMDAERLATVVVRQSRSARRRRSLRDGATCGRTAGCRVELNCEHFAAVACGGTPRSA